MLDYRKCCISKFIYQLYGCIYINKIVIRKFFTIQLVNNY